LFVIAIGFPRDRFEHWRQIFLKSGRISNVRCHCEHEERTRKSMTNTSPNTTGRFAPVEQLPWLGITPNEPYQRGDSIFDRNGYRLAIVEFDDEGRCYDRRQMTALAGELDRLSAADAVIVVFVHGWKHNGRSNDDNLKNFMQVLEDTARQQGPGGLPVLGVFVAWRGLSLFGLGLENLTFWDRKQAGLRVSTGRRANCSAGCGTSDLGA
jgi:hypothetical protein